MDFAIVIAHFAVILRDYCNWLEGRPLTAEREHFEAMRLVSALYAGAIALPELRQCASADHDSPALLEPQRKAIMVRLKEFPFQYYWEIYDPILPKPEAPVCGDITDDLADIYYDLKPGLILFEAGHEMAAAWQWRCMFSHWGDHATSAIRALHRFEP